MVIDPWLAAFVCSFVVQVVYRDGVLFLLSFSFFHKVFYSCVRSCPVSQLGVCLLFFLPLKLHIGSVLTCFCIFSFFLSLFYYGMTWMGYIAIQFLASVQSPPHFYFYFFPSLQKKLKIPFPLLSLCSHRFGFFLSVFFSRHFFSFLRPFPLYFLVRILA